MKRLSIGIVGAWSLILMAFSLAYYFKPSATLPAQFVYLFIGILGILVQNELQSQIQRTSQLENRIRDLENSTNN